MSRHPELDRLAATRPPLLDHTELVVDAEEEGRILRQILSTSRPAAGSSRARRRSLRLVFGGLGALAAAVGVVVAATVLPAGSAPAGRAGAHRGTDRGPTPVVSVETVAERTAAAVTGAVRKDILYSQTEYASDAGVPWSMATIREWSHGAWARQQSFSRRGTLTEDASAVVRDGQRVRRFVEYTRKTWEHDTYPVAKWGPGPSARQTVRMLLGRPPAGRETRTITPVNVQGRPEYRVTLAWPLRQGEDFVEGWSQQFAQAMFFPDVSGGHAMTGATILLEAATYLPQRVTINGSHGRVLAVENLSWLPPSRASRAELHPAPVPAGFRNVTPPAR